MSWTAALPLKRGPERKSRLAGRLSAQARAALSDAMAAHVIACLTACPEIGRIVLLSPDAPDDPSLEWHKDTGHGLNHELAALRAAHAGESLMVIHGDLPLLTSDDIAALLFAAGSSRVAIAPDIHGKGTNALALPAVIGDFTFAFGDNSFALHQAAAASGAVRIDRPGLAIDVDTSADLDRALSAGFTIT